MNRISRSTILVLALAGASLLAAQTVPPPAAPTPGTDLPAQSIGVFVNYDAYNVPHVTGGFSVSKLVSSLPYETIVSANTSFQPLKSPRGALLTTVTASVEQVVAHAGPFHLLAIGSFGAATNGNNAAADYSGGGGLIYKLPTRKLWFDSLKVTAATEHSAITSTIGSYKAALVKGF